jgi:ATP-dependent Clp protease adaptor protein ClpS
MARGLCHDGGVTAAPVEEILAEEQIEGEATAELAWVTVVWNDPINLMDYVTYVFMTYFKYPRAKAQQLMLDVHERGKAVVSSGTREEMEVHVAAMHSYGLWATAQRGS